LPESSFNIARVGISLYGLWPSKEARISARVIWPEIPKLSPVLSWKCKSQSIKKISQGSFIGYGCTYRTDRDLKICLLPIGYYDGYPRMLSNKAFVLVNGKRCQVLGRIMMNHIIIDVTEAVSSEESSVVATLIGTDGKETISVETIAAWAETIHYEIIARVGAHLKRVVVD
jgi:alanine racemase